MKIKISSCRKEWNLKMASRYVYCSDLDEKIEIPVVIAHVRVVQKPNHRPVIQSVGERILKIWKQTNVQNGGLRIFMVCKKLLNAPKFRAFLNT